MNTENNIRLIYLKSLTLRKTFTYLFMFYFLLTFEHKANTNIIVNININNTHNIAIIANNTLKKIIPPFLLICSN